jgi:hypothetical protein
MSVGSCAAQPQTRRIIIMASLVLALGLVCALPLLGADRWRVDVTLEATSVYHLACLADSLPCTRQVFERFWHDELQWTPADAEALTAWKSTFSGVSDRASAATPAPFVGNTFALRPKLQAQRELIAALLEASSAEDLERQTTLDLEQARALRKAVDHVSGRLSSWLAKTARPRVRVDLRQAERLLHGPALSTLRRQRSPRRFPTSCASPTGGPSPFAHHARAGPASSSSAAPTRRLSRT